MLTMLLVKEDKSLFIQSINQHFSGSCKTPPRRSETQPSQSLKISRFPDGIYHSDGQIEKVAWKPNHG